MPGARRAWLGSFAPAARRAVPNAAPVLPLLHGSIAQRGRVLCNRRHTTKRMPMLSTIGRHQLLEGRHVTHMEPTATLIEDAPAAPRGELATDPCARDAEHGGELGVGNPQCRPRPCPRWLAAVEQDDEELGQPAGQVWKGGNRR